MCVAALGYPSSPLGINPQPQNKVLAVFKSIKVGAMYIIQLEHKPSDKLPNGYKRQAPTGQNPTFFRARTIWDAQEMNREWIANNSLTTDNLALDSGSIYSASTRQKIATVDYYGDINFVEE